MCRPLALPAAAAAAAGSALAQRLGGLTEPADAAAGRATLRALAAWRTAAERLRAALPLLRALSPAARRRAAADATAAALAALTVGGGVAVAKSHPATAEADERSALFAEALALYRPEAVSALLPEDPEVLQPLAAAGWGLREALRAGPGERAAARRASTRELHDVLPPDAQRQMFLVRICTKILCDVHGFPAVSQPLLRSHRCSRVVSDIGMPTSCHQRFIARLHLRFGACCCSLL